MKASSAVTIAGGLFVLLANRPALQAIALLALGLIAGLILATQGVGKSVGERVNRSSQVKDMQDDHFVTNSRAER